MCSPYAPNVPHPLMCDVLIILNGLFPIMTRILGMDPIRNLVEIIPYSIYKKESVLQIEISRG